ncbi:AMP-dependent synthetase/ligase [candidate division CSSED10-310 bacterium]|uniref:AMP-dependent synthetase/ligase n=1 Tax=candidate division CSSED10-310 bacterium TaxID=2855610 RepID=A0ABV6YW62_UNCC1
MVEYIIPKVFQETVANNREKVALRYKEEGVYKDILYNEFGERVHNTALGLLTLGVEFQHRVSIISKNRPEWAIADQGIQMLGAINVPIYDTLNAPQMAYIIDNSEGIVIFCEDEAQLDKVIQIKEKVKSLQKVVVMDPVPPDKKLDYVLTFDELMALGKSEQAKYEPVLQENLAKIKEDDLCSLVYTSGTTGPPKGVMLTHKNFMSNVFETLKTVPINSDDCVLSFLPLSHVLERMAGYYSMICVGGTIGYAVSIDTVGDNMGEVQPTFMVSVPRLYEKMYARILEKVESDSPLKQKIFHWATSVGTEYLIAQKKGETSLLLNIQFAIADHLVFSKLKQRTGGKLRFFVSGGAPLAKHLGEFFASAGILILEGYGLTESSPVITANRIENHKFGSVGLPIPGVEVKIAEDGEILARGPNIMKGYYKNEEATREALEEIEGDIWLHTGDIGHLDEDGFLFITDRKKEIIVMSNGKNVAPQPIENLLKSNKYISQAILIGNNRKYMAALIAPDFDQLNRFAQEKDLSISDPEELVTTSEVRALFDNEIEELMQDLPRYEKVKKYHLLPRDLSQEDGELTPTLKAKRKVIDQHFAKEIENLYEE